MMDLRITGRHVAVTEAIRSYIEKKIQKLERFSHRIISVQVTVQVQRFNQIVEIIVTGKNLDLIVKETEKDMYSAFDLALDRIVLAVERQEEKKKGRKRKDRKAREKMKSQAEARLIKKGFPEIVRVGPPKEPPMTVQEAVMVLEAKTQNHFLAFENAETGQMNVLYRRDDGHLGWIEPR